MTTSASSGAIDDDDILTPNKTEANALRRIRSEIKAMGHNLSQDEIDELKREYRRSALRASQEFVKRAVLKFEVEFFENFGAIFLNLLKFSKKIENSLRTFFPKF